MTEQEFLAQNAVKPAGNDEQEFLKSSGAIPLDQDGLLSKNIKNTGGALAGVGDMIMGIPKMGAQAALALTARAMAPRGTTLNDTWNAAGQMIDSSPYTPNVGKLTGTDTNPGYQAVNAPFQKLGEGIDWTANKTQQGLAPVIGNQAAGDVSGQVSMLANAFGADLGMRALHGVGKGLKSMLPKSEADFVDQHAIQPLATPPQDQPTAPQYSSQDELPLTNSVEDVASNQNAQGNQSDMFNNNQGSAPIPYDPTARIPDTAQGELPLQNSVQDVANQSSDPMGQQDMFGGAQNQISTDPMSQIPEITPQVALRKALDAEDAGKQAEAAFWRERAMEMVREERTKQATTPQEPIHVNDQGTASDPATMDALTRSTQGITYENVPPDGVIPRNSPRAGLEVPSGNNWQTDENGIPVRQGLPTDTPDLSTPTTVQGILNSDTGVRNDLGNAIQEANGPKLGPDEHYGAGQLETPSPAFNNLINGDRGPGRNQRGSAPIMEDLASGIAKGISSLGHTLAATGDLLRKTSSDFEDKAAIPLKKLIGATPEDHMARVSGIPDMIYKPPSGDSIVAQGLAEGAKTTRLMPNLQSGMTLAGQKVGSSILKGAAQWLQWQDKRTHFDNRTQVDPIQGQLKKLLNTDPKTYQDLSKTIMREQATRTLMSPGDLARTLSPKAVGAYKALRGALEDAYVKTKASRKAAGKDPISREEAYAASLRHGDFHQSIYGKDGTLLWHVASETQANAIKARNWIRDTHEGNTGIDWDKSSEIWNSNDSGTVGIPRDIMDTYRQALKLIDPNNPVTALLEDSIRKINEDHGQGYAGHDSRFLDKNNVPGFEGNKPWLSDRENAHAFLNSQLGYLRNSNRWNNFQEALNNLNPILSNKDLLRNQPNIMKTVVAHVNRELGLTPSVFKETEKSLAKLLPSFGTGEWKASWEDKQLGPVAIGRSVSNMYSFGSSLKHATYLTQLGFNPALALTVPLQSALAIAQHRVMTLEGHNHNPLDTLVNTIRDAGGGLARHTMSSMTGKMVDTPMTGIGKKMLQYAEDNGILDKTVLDESGPLHNGGILGPVKRTLGATITAPEKLSRYTTFVGFAHHLLADGKMSEPDAFRKAEEFTNNSLTSMRRSDRPIVVDKLGVTGQMAYTYKSFLFNEYNQLSQLGQMKNKTPLLMHVVTLYALGGMLGLPGVGELDNGWDMIKNLVAKVSPENYAAISGLGLKGWIMKNLPTSMSLGPISDATGTNIGTRSSSQTANLLDPLGNIAAPIQEMVEAGSAGSALLHPTEQRRWEDAIHAQAPPLGKSMMEAHLDDYKNKDQTTPDGRNADGTMTYRSATSLMNSNAVYNRTPAEETIRKLGMYSDKEYNTKSINFINDKEQERVNTAYKNNINNAVTAFLDARTKGAGKLVVGQNYAREAFKLIPDQDKLEKAINDAALASKATPEQLDMIRANSMNSLEKVIRANH